MKKFILILFLFTINTTVFADETESIIGQQIESMNISQLQQQLDQINNNNYSDIFKSFNIKNVVKSLSKGNFSWDIKNILKLSFSFYFKQLYISIKIMLILIILAIIGALIENLQNSFDKEGVGNVAFFVCFSMVAGVGIQLFLSAISEAKNVIDNIVVFMNALMPVLLTLLAASGGVVSAAAIHPMVLAATSVVSIVIKNTIIPFVLIMTALRVTDNISQQISVARMAKLIGTIIKWLTGILLTLFIGVIGLFSITAPALDVVTLKTTKYAVGNFVPVVGGLLSDSVDLVFGCSLVLKNAVGVAGLIAIILIFFSPSVSLLAQATMLHITAAVIEPISDKRITSVITILGESLIMIFAMLLTITVMFVISIAVIVSIGGAT